MEDIIETLLGREIMDETDTVKDMQALARSKDQKNINWSIDVKGMWIV